MKLFSDSRGMAIPVVIAVIFVLAILAFGIYRFASFEKNLIARFQCASVAEKLAQAVTLEAASIFNFKAVNFKKLDRKDGLDRFVLAPVSEPDIDNIVYNMNPDEMKSFEIASELGAKIDWVEMKYEKFRKYFNDPPVPSSYEKSCFVPSDPLERYGGLIISSKVTYKSTSRIFCCRYEIKTSQTLAPVISKFTLFVKNEVDGDQNKLRMACPIPEKTGTPGAPKKSGSSAASSRNPSIISGDPGNVWVNESYGSGQAGYNGDHDNGGGTSGSDLSILKNARDGGSIQRAGGGTIVKSGVGNWEKNNERLTQLKQLSTYLQGNRGVIDDKTADLRVPLVLVHHPADMSAVSGYGKTHAEIREYLPMDETIAPVGAGNGLNYRPSMINRGWIYLGSDDPKHLYIHNVSPGKINPADNLDPTPSTDRLFYGNAFMLREYGLPVSIGMCKNFGIPYQFSFCDFSMRPKVDYILRTTQTGIYWIFKDSAMGNVLGNYYLVNREMSPNSSLLQMAGDMQVRRYSDKKPSEYLDRRSPTIVFGKVFRMYMQIGQIAQNCNHPSGSPYFKEMQSNGLHEMPYVKSDHAHPQMRWLPFFNIDRDGNSTSNPAVDLTGSDEWKGLSAVDDAVQSDLVTPTPDNVDFMREKYSVKDDIFKSENSHHLKTYKYFMTKPLIEPFNRTYDMITANSGPAAGIFKMNDKYFLKQDQVKILSSYPDARSDDQMFYGEENNFGNCLYGNRIKISQYKTSSAGKFDLFTGIYPDGIFRGALQAVELVSKKYQNPMKSETPVIPEGYDLRYKADYVFNSYSEFESACLKTSEVGVLEFKFGGVFYIDSDQTVDITKSKKISRMVFHDNTMFIFKKGVKIPSINKSRTAKKNGSTLTLVSVDGDITLCGEEFEASLNALNGTFYKETDYFQVFGNMTMKEISFAIEDKGNIFRVGSYPAGNNHPVLGGAGLSGYKRISVVYDPALDPCDSDNYSDHYCYNISSRQTYWRIIND